MIFPISDDDKNLKRFGWVTLLLIIANIAVFAYQQVNPAFTSGYAAIPKEIIQNVDLVEGEIITGPQGQRVEIPQEPGPKPIFLTIFSAMFMHGGLMHIGSNMLFLWIFGDNVENRFGSFRFLVFYLVSGMIASLVHILMAPFSVIPSLGASGAIAGVLGAYLVMFPRNKVNALLFFVKVISVPAFIMILLWGGMQFYHLFTQSNEFGGGVAYGAHAGGLVAGIVLGLFFRLLIEDGKEPDSVLYRNYENDPKARRGWL